ncbi:MAG: c-type cytochrome, partial [Planctomycetaceae bacterium]|nr:c-type cytochrome [Planctomycetaceae bacterium]
RLDGSDVRVHCGGGFDNPVEIEFTEEGELLGTVNILYPNRGDCLMHWVEGGVYPREDQQDCISEFKWTGGLLGPIVDMGHVAVSGLMRYRGIHFGPEYNNHLFITEFNTHKVKRVALKRSGSTFAAEPMEFLTCPDGDFHPTDVLEDADGSLLVVDTGAWFLNGCPTSRVAKPEVTGAIYRIRKTDGEKIDDPRGLRLRLADAAPAELIKHLDDPRPTVRESVMSRLSSLKFDDWNEAVINAQMTTTPPTASAMRLVEFTAVRTNAPESWGCIPTRLHETPTASGAFAVSEFAALGVVRGDVFSGLSHLLKDQDPVIRLAACQAIAKLNQQILSYKGKARTSLSKVILEAASSHDDRTLEHMEIVAMTRLADAETLQGELHGSKAHRQRIALIALDQIDNSPLTAAMVTPLLATDDPTLQKTVLEVLARHPGWAKEALGTIREWLGEKDLADDKANAIRTLLVAQAGDPDVQKLIASVVAGRETASGVEALLWEVMQRADVATWPMEWSPLLQHALVNGDPQHQLVALRIIQRRELPDFDAAMAPIADRTETAPLLRSEALTAMGPRLKDIDDKRFAFLVTQLEKDRDTSLKMAAARAASVLPLSGKQLIDLSGHFDAAGPLVISTLLKAFERSTDDHVGAALVSGLRQSSIAESLSGDEVSALVRRYSGMVHQLALPLIKQLGVDVEAQQARLTQLAPLITDGDGKAGERVFFGKKANCSACHAVAGKGARIGPDLSRIGQSRTGKDLLEAIVYPSASFVNGYRPHVAQLENGKTVQGIIAAESNDAITLRTADLQEVRVLRKDIEELKESSTSIMPKGLDTQLTPDELRHLLAYLQGRK